MLNFLLAVFLGLPNPNKKHTTMLNVDVLERKATLSIKF